MQRYRPELFPSWHGDLPVFRRRRMSQDGQVASRVDQGGFDPVLAQLLQGGIDGHALRNSSEIELNTDGEGHLPTYRIYLNAAPSSSRLPGDDRIETDSRKIIEGAVIAKLHQLVQQGRIVYSLCSLSCCERSRQDSIEQVTDGHRCSRVRIELRQLTF